MTPFDRVDDLELEFVPFEVPGVNEICETHTVIVGDLQISTPPLVVLHDGPGTGFEYLFPLTEIPKRYNMTVIFYDQIGCGLSTHFPEKKGDKSFWTFELYIEQLRTLIGHFDLENKGFHLLGHGWGGMLAGEFASRRPMGLQKLIIASGPSSMPLYVEGLKALIASLPGNAESLLASYKPFEDGPEPEVLDLVKIFSSRHNYRIRESTENESLVSASTNLRAAPEAYLTIMGPLQFDCIGSCKNWEGWRQAHRIEVQTLLINGRHDYVTSNCMDPWREIPNVEFMTFEESSHMYHWEETVAFIDVVYEFLITEEDYDLV